MNEIKPVAKSDLLAQINAGWMGFVELLSLLSETEMTQSGVQGVWAIKDVLAHIAAWERLTAARLESAFSGSDLDFVPPTTSEEVDQINEKVFNENKSKTLHTVREEFDTAHQDLVAKIESLPGSFLESKLKTTWWHDEPVQLLIMANTIWHYAEHSEVIENWLAQKS